MPGFAICFVLVVVLIIASLVAPVFGAIGYVISSIVAKILDKNPQHINKPVALITTVVIFILTFCGFSYYAFEGPPPPPVPNGFEQSDLIGTWRATYGGPDTIDTIKLKSDGTYQQVFQSPASDYYYEGSWNRWYLENTADGRPKLHLEGMKYCIFTIDMCKATGHGEALYYYDFIDDAGVELTNELILRVVGDENSPRGLLLLQMPVDPDEGAERFVFIDE